MSLPPFSHSHLPRRVDDLDTQGRHPSKFIAHHTASGLDPRSPLSPSARPPVTPARPPARPSDRPHARQTAYRSTSHSILVGALSTARARNKATRDNCITIKQRGGLQRKRVVHQRPHLSWWFALLTDGWTDKRTFWRNRRTGRTDRTDGTDSLVKLTDRTSETDRRTNEGDR